MACQSIVEQEGYGAGRRHGHIQVGGQLPIIGVLLGQITLLESTTMRLEDGYRVAYSSTLTQW